MFDIFALVFLSVAALLIGTLLCTYAYVKIFKGGPYHSEKNPKGLPKYKTRKDTAHIPVEHSHGHSEPHV